MGGAPTLKELILTNMLTSTSINLKSCDKLPFFAIKIKKILSGLEIICAQNLVFGEKDEIEKNAKNGQIYIKFYNFEL